MALELSQGGQLQIHGKPMKSSAGGRKGKTSHFVNTFGKKSLAPTQAFSSGQVIYPGARQADSEELNVLIGKLKEKLTVAGIVATTNMRVRGAHSKERRVHVEYYPDPGEKGAVFMRLIPATVGDEAAFAIEMQSVERSVSTMEVATMLQYSRPYAAKLCDSGVFGPVERSEGGHRRVSFDRVLAYQQERQEMSNALDVMAELTTGPQQRDAELANAQRAATGKRWVKTKAASAK